MDGPAALNSAMDERRIKIRKRWKAIAEDAGMSIGHLTRIRKGDAPLTEFAAAGLDNALGWDTGEAWRIYHEAGGWPGDQPPFELVDETERRIWRLGTLPSEERIQLIEQHRADKNNGKRNAAS
jgi:hypothetical protein